MKCFWRPVPSFACFVSSSLQFRLSCGTPESGPFGPNPPLKTQFLVHFVPKKGPFGRPGVVRCTPPPLATGLLQKFWFWRFTPFGVNYLTIYCLILTKLDVKWKKQCPVHKLYFKCLHNCIRHQLWFDQAEVGSRDRHVTVFRLFSDFEPIVEFETRH